MNIVLFMILFYGQLGFCLSDPDWLVYLNSLRSLHNVPPLQISDSLTNVAQNVALWNSNLGRLEHSNLRYGENLAYIPNSNIITAIQLCYNEINQYDFSNPGFTAGHFTQLVWKNTKYIGIGVINGYIAMEFDPPGNYADQYIYNVFPSNIPMNKPPQKKPPPLIYKYPRLPIHLPSSPSPSPSPSNIPSPPFSFKSISPYHIIIAVPLNKLAEFTCDIPNPLIPIEIIGCMTDQYSSTKKYIDMFFNDDISITKSSLTTLIKQSISKKLFIQGSTIILMNYNVVLLRSQQ
jgi:hypothetical protein